MKVSVINYENCNKEKKILKKNVHMQRPIILSLEKSMNKKHSALRSIYHNTLKRATNHLNSIVNKTSTGQFMIFQEKICPEKIFQKGNKKIN